MHFYMCIHRNKYMFFSKWVSRYILFCGLLFSHDVLEIFPHQCAQNNLILFSILWWHHNLFYHSSIDKHLVFFFTIINNTVVKIFVLVSYPYAQDVLWITYIKRKLLQKVVCTLNFVRKAVGSSGKLTLMWS